jgi:hypothetical protein
MSPQTPQDTIWLQMSSVGAAEADQLTQAAKAHDENGPSRLLSRPSVTSGRSPIRSRHLSRAEVESDRSGRRDGARGLGGATE